MPCALCGYPALGGFNVAVPGVPGAVMHTISCGPALHGVDQAAAPTVERLADDTYRRIPPVSIALLVITDGRDEYLRQTLDSAAEMLGPGITERWMWDDTGDAGHQQMLRDQYPAFRVVGEVPRQGFGGAIRAAWNRLAFESDARYVFHLEGDFVFPRAIDLATMADLLEDCPHLAQLALRRQPWWTEPQPGGFMQQYPDWYEDYSFGVREWVETTRNFTTNPCLYRRQLCVRGWPDDPNSEGRYGFRLRERGLPWGVPGDAVRFGYWGSKASGEWCHHIGHERTGTGY